jgi:hypothetical protein
MAALVVATSIGAASGSGRRRVCILGSMDAARRFHLFPHSIRCRPVVRLPSDSHKAHSGCRWFFVPFGNAELAFPRPLLSTDTRCIRDNGRDLLMRFSLDAAEVFGAFCAIVWDLRRSIWLCPASLDLLFEAI